MTLTQTPIAVVLDELSAVQPFPDVAIAQCALRMEEATPHLLAVLEKAANGEELPRKEEVLLFRAVYLLGGNRREVGFKPLLRLLAQDPDRVDELLGDAITESLPKIAAGMFDGDAAALFAAITNSTADEFVRASLLRAAAFLTFDGRIGRQEMTSFLQGFCGQRLAPAGDHVWSAWVDAVSLLGITDMVALARTVFDEGLLPELFMEWRHFESDLAWALRAPDDPERIEKAHVGYIADILEELGWTRRWQEYEEDPLEEDFAAGFGSDLLTHLPAVNIYRDVGRNDPCPCGSGKKYKKCCLGNGAGSG